MLSWATARIRRSIPPAARIAGRRHDARALMSHTTARRRPSPSRAHAFTHSQALAVTLNSVENCQNSPKRDARAGLIAAQHARADR